MENKSKILVVDDKGIDRYMLGCIFGEEHDVLEASGGQEAINVITGLSDALSIVLLDIIMPGVDGFGVLEYMREKQILDTLPVIIVTDDDSEETTVRAFEYKVADIVIKPYEPRIIKRRVENIIELYTYKKKERLYGG
ncbi:MAG: response regulator [Lachnospiraceae bacterium]|nr:response regulator [Lachnospiraceae bacterium]